jgi:hypothetical protein
MRGSIARWDVRKDDPQPNSVHLRRTSMKVVIDVTGKELRTLADAAWDAGQKDLSQKLHSLAREVEAKEGQI